ncbi:hypothetical protein [Amycolatopsis sp. NPDC004079]|uniref:hypothetical protein n=1 Tax=Amycolatopsis sp. NPDC004079 TaxID=3154549 RepID=UPI0033AA559D
MTDNPATEHRHADIRHEGRTDPPITFSLPRGDALLMLASAQLHQRDAGLDAQLARDLRRAGHAVQDAVCAAGDPILVRSAEAGWDPAADTVLTAGEHDLPAERYAFAIEDSHNGESWCPRTETGTGVVAGVEEVHDHGPGAFARRALARFFAGLDPDAADDESWYRCTVWNVARAVGY